ncbi:MAG TPA: hypothetical protein VK448_09535 [Dissulfurispiraceae bacterium]|nr:hypothetical protein [Dissulfurispiraceae bacterium]
MTFNNIKRFYRALLFICAVYFLAVAIIHQTGIKISMLFVFYDIPSERYQDLIISFLAAGWSMLFLIGFLDDELKPRIQIPIIVSGVMAICGLIRARMEVQFHSEVNYEIIALAFLLFALIAAYYKAVVQKR